MQKLEVFIEENAFGSVRPVEIVSDAPVGALLPALVEELKLPRKDLYGKKLVYMLRHSPEGRILPENTTLEASGVQSGSRLILDAYVIDGSVETLMSNNAEQPIKADPALYSSVTLTDSEAFSPDRKRTSSLLPPLEKKKDRKWTRRAFVLAGGALLGVAGTGVGYAAYSGLLGRAFNTTRPSGVTNTTTRQTRNMMQQPSANTIPTMAKPLTTFNGHQKQVRAVAWSPDGTLLASGADDMQLLFWGLDTAVRHKQMQKAPIRAAVWSPDGKQVAIATGNQIMSFDGATGALLNRSQQRGHTKAILTLVWSLQGKSLVSGGQDNLAIVWDANLRPITTFKRHTTAVDGVSLSPDGQTVASATLGTGNGVARVWNAASGQELHGGYLINTHMRAVAFAPMGMQLAISGDDGGVRIWSGLSCQNTGQGAIGAQCMDVPQLLQASQMSVRALAWSPDGRFLATGAEDGMIALWNTAQPGMPLLSTKLNAPVRSISWSPDGRKLAAASGNAVSIFEIV